VDETRPHVARVYDYLLGGTDNLPPDRAVGDQIIAALPAARTGVRAQREVLARVVRFLVQDAGITRLLDIGSGLPTADNVHQIARRADPAARVVYVDNDPAVVGHARTLLAGDELTAVVDGDLRDPDAILAQAREHLGWDRPVGLLLCGILHYIPDEQDPAGIMATLAAALPAGSYVFIHHLLHSDDEALETAMKRGLGNVRFRTREEILGLFAGLDLIEPGLVPVARWRPDGPVSDDPVLSLACAGVAIKPA
jgi:hypothetical protein